jgi:iron(III) transport system permease protein
MVLALGFIWAYVGGFLPTKFLYGSLIILILAFTVRSLPIGCRVMTGTMHQIGNELEESSRVLGASWFETFRRILAPLLIPSAISVWILVFMITVSDLSTAILLSGPDSQVLSVLMFDYYWARERTAALVIGVINTALVLGVAVVARFVASKQELSS